MYRLAASLAALSLLLANQAMSKSDAILPYQAAEKTLPNGLKVIVVPTGFPNLVSLQIPVMTGSRNEVEPGKTGFAHFFEHMMFRGTRNYPPDKYEAIITRAGARQNAYTTDDYTNYHVTFAKEDLEKILEIEADRFQNLEYPLASFQTEARAVLGEYNKNIANPIRKLFEVQRDSAYRAHTYKHTTMGFIQDIEDMPNQFEYSKQFFERWYRPHNTTVIVAGDVVPEQVFPLVEKYWGAWKAGSFKADIPVEPEPTGAGYVHYAWTTPTQPLIAVAFHGPAFSETATDGAAIDLLMTVLFGESSPLYQRLVVEEQKIDLLSADSVENVDPSLITVLARVKDAADVLYVRDAILETLAGASALPVDAGRLAETRSYLKYGLSASLDNTDSIASMLARFVRYSRSFDTLNGLFRTYERLTPADLQAAAAKYVTDRRLHLTTLASDPMPNGMGTLPKLASLVRSASAESRLLVQRSPSPQIVTKLLFLTGSGDDPAGQEGLAELASRMVADAGSAALTLSEIQKRRYPMAGDFSAQVDREMTVFTGSVHKDNLAAFTEIALGQLLTPGMRAEDFARNRDDQVNALLLDLRSNNDEELGKERLQANVFAGSRYGHPTLGTEAALAALTADDVRGFMAKHYTSGNLKIALSGDVPAGYAEELERRMVAALPAGRAQHAAKPAPAANASNGLSVEIIAKDTRAVAISLGHAIDVTRAHPDFVALWLARTWLGEHRSSMSHLYQRIREIRGMNYGDYAYIEAFPGGMFRFFPSPNRARLGQLFEVWIRPVPPEQAHFALRCALYELDRLVADGLTQEAFESTREYLMKNVYVLTDGQANNLGYALDSWYWHTPAFTDFMREGLKQLTLADVNAAIRRHLSPESLYVVMVAPNADELRAQLLSDAFSPMTYNSEKPAELLAEDQVIGARRLGLKLEDVVVTPVDRVFAE